MAAHRERKLTSANAKKGTSATGPGSRAAAPDPWDQSRPDKASVQEPLTASKLVKGDAEYTRQNIANEILEAAKTVCGELSADTERTLEKARYLESEADRKQVEAHEERERATEIRLEAEEYRESLIEDAKRQSAEHIERARMAAERECSELKQRASIESEKMMAQAQVMRAAAQEELEAQKIYAEAARFKAASQESLTQARNRLDDARTSEQLKPGILKKPQVPASEPEPVKTNIGDPVNDPSGHQSQIDRATAIARGTVGNPPSPKGANGRAGAMDSLQELRSMQTAAAKAVDSALAQERKPAKSKRTAKSKKTTTKKS